MSGAQNEKSFPDLEDDLLNASSKSNVKGEVETKTVKAMFMTKPVQGKANVVTDALSRKERVKPRRVRAMAMTIQYGVRGMILEAQSEAFKQENVLAERLHGTVIMDEAHKSKYSVHPGADKMYHDLRDMYWWPGMKRDIATYVIKDMRHAHDTGVIVDRLTKSAHFLAIREDYSTERLAKIYIDEIVARHGVPVSIISDRDGRACVIDFGGSWDVHLPLAEFSYNNSYHSSIRCAPFEALYGRKCRSPVLWAEIRESSLFGPELVQEMIDKVSFKEGDHVLLKVSPWKGVVRFGKKGKLALRYVGPFEILERFGHVAYRLRLPKELSGVHDMFHVCGWKT
ncbi:putative reverse transcriptase domain-containing protein [Tanacetum coccineum]